MPPVLRIVDLQVAYGPGRSGHAGRIVRSGHAGRIVRSGHAGRRSMVVLDDVSLTFPAGTVATVVGPNGAGKTSLLRAVSGLLGFHGGRVVGGRIDCPGPVAHVLEGGRVFGDLTVEENLRAGGHRVARQDLPARVRWVLERFPVLAVRLTTRAGHLSGGERQLLSIGRAVVHPPRVLLLDEPTVGLAAGSVAAVAAVVRELAAAGTVVVVAEPQAILLPEAPVVRLEQGRVVSAGQLAPA